MTNNTDVSITSGSGSASKIGAPIVGNYKTISSTGTLTLAEGSNNSVDISIDRTNSNVEMLQINLSASSVENVDISRLVITQLNRPTSPAVIKWASEISRSYRVTATTSLVHTAFAPIAVSQLATPPENSYSDPAAAGQPKKFYRIELE